MELDRAFCAAGEFGRCQRRLVAVLLGLQVYVACQSVLIVLVGAVPEYHIDQEEIPRNPEELASHVHFADNFTSIVTEWCLIKQEAYKVSLTSSLFFAGLLIGNLTFGPLSDRLGRKPVYLTVCFLLATRLAPRRPTEIIFLYFFSFWGKMVECMIETTVQYLVPAPYKMINVCFKA